MKRPWIIKAGGELLATTSIRKKILSDLARLNRREPVVFVHGGGPQIEQKLNENKIRVQFIAGRRVTTDAAMTVVEEVLSGSINKSVVAELGQKNVLAVGLSCRDGKLIIGKTRAMLGRAGIPHKVNPTLLRELIKSRILAVVCSVASDAKGLAMNINADDAASALAVALKAKRVVFLTNVPGVLDNKKKTIKILRSKKAPSLIQSGVISGGMIPKVQSALAALKKGVGEVDIVNGREGINFNYGTRIVS